MCRPVHWLWGLVPVAFLAVVAYSFTVPQFEHELGLRTASDLANAGQNWARVSVEGRDVTLHGTAPSKQHLDDAIDVAASADGVRHVHDDAIIRIAPAN